MISGVIDSRFRRLTCYTLAIVLAVAFVGCVGGPPRVPDDPDAALALGDREFQRKRYVNSREVFRGFLQRYPGHEKSDYAQFMVAESYMGEGEWALAAVEFRILVTNYGYSDYVDDGYLGEACALHEQAPKSRLDQRKNEEALVKLERFVQVFANSPLVPKAEAKMNEIREILAEKAYNAARFYMRQRRYRSAIVYYDKVIDNYPNNEYWARACYEKGTIMKRREEVDEAIQLFSKVLSYPGDTPVKALARDSLKELRLK
jgi:outer membrane protein assembly factor BamD